MSLNDRVAARVVMVTISHECRFLKEEDILKTVCSLFQSAMASQTVYLERGGWLCGL